MASPTFFYNDHVVANGEFDERPRVPLIHLAQAQMRQQWEEEQRRLDAVRQEAGDSDEEVQEVSEGNAPKKSKSLLSTITERTERTEFSPNWPNNQLAPPRAPSSTTGTSYGEVINTGRFADHSSADPNLIPVSPSLSAQQRLSVYEPAPSVPTSGSRSSVTSSPKPPSEPVPPLDTIPDIPDTNSKSTPPTAQKSEAKQSKLSLLASSRASTRSKSSASLGTEKSGSVKTYPGLRPSALSAALPASSIQLYVPDQKSLPSLPPLSPTSANTQNVRSSTDSHIRRAIQMAIDLEEGDKKTGTPSTRSESYPSSASSARTPVPTASKVPAISGTPTQTVKPPSKLALLAQAKAAKSEAKAGKPITKAKGPLDTKLSSPPVLPAEHTEYLTPIANGSSVTTAITTSYQSLYSLTDPARPPTSPAPYVVPLSAVQSLTSPSKPSKLALKSRKAKEKQVTASPEEQKVIEPAVPEIFLPKSSRSRREEQDLEARRKERKVSGKEVAPATRKHDSVRRRHIATNLSSTSSSFSFESLSPDDIVANARRGTSLADRRDRRTAASSKA
ncbi:hypothetical protein K435DRAFT_745162 [Dendrothele bispora CBS 962.96]|uniref:Uncharacterized protein n=1 Tax=Dendrothele bispora (strain CBS 962.96) TaxID=1314807 RepID=A0A4S8MS30_DENBC|nr:hypothetical protein K435DRAFT_745162 [Dendrothele bispora CBS 962.96]